MEKILDETVTRRRLLQHGSIFLGMMLLILARLVVSIPGGSHRGWGALALAVGLFAIACGFRVKIRWEVPYKQHSIRFENDPVRGEQLYIDGELVARGGLGFRRVLHARIKDGGGAGDFIEAVSHAGLLSFRCRVTAYPSGSAAPTNDANQ